MNKVLVTGASGMLGSRVCFDLSKQGYQVSALLTEPGRQGALHAFLQAYGDESVRNAIRPVYGELSNPDELSEACAGMNFIVHCAAKVSFHKKDRRLLREVNVLGTRNLVNAALFNKVPRFIHISSVAAIPASLPFKTKKPFLLGGRTPYSYYGLTKYRSELEAWRGREEGLVVNIVRPSVILGPGDWKTGSSALVGRMARGMRFVSPGSTGFIDVRDASAAVLHTLKHNPDHPILVLNAWNDSYEHFFGSLAAHLRVSPARYVAGKGMANLLCAAEYLLEFISGRKALLTPETVQSAFSFKEYPVELEQKLPGFKYTSAEESLAWLSALYEARPA